jgi:DNA-binding MarR family transcriptional regulator
MTVKIARKHKPTPVAAQPASAQHAEEPRDVRLRNQYFKDAESVVFDTKGGGFVPLPILLRKLLRHLTAPELRLLVYLYTRSGKQQICYPTIDEVAGELDLNRKNLTRPLKELERKRLITTTRAGGKIYFLIHDPRVALEHLVNSGEIGEDELFLVNELCRDIKRPPISARPSRS